MNRLGIGMLAAGVALAVATGDGGAQERPSVSHSESARDSGPTCVVGGEATDCAGSVIGRPVGPTIVGAPMAGAPMPVVVSSVGLVGPAGVGGVGTDTEVAHSTRSGSAIER